MRYYTLYQHNWNTYILGQDMIGLVSIYDVDVETIGEKWRQNLT